MPKLKSHQIYLKMSTAVSLKVLNTKSDIGILKFLIQNLNFGKLVPKLKSCWIYLKMSTLVNLKVLNTNLTMVFKDYISKI